MPSGAGCAPQRMPWCSRAAIATPSSRSPARASVARVTACQPTTEIAAPTGSTTELAGGFTLAMSLSINLYGEIGKLWASGGDANQELGQRLHRRAGEVVMSGATAVLAGSNACQYRFILLR